MRPSVDATDALLYREAAPMRRQTWKKREFQEEMWFMSDRMRCRCTMYHVRTQARSNIHSRDYYGSRVVKKCLRVLKHSPLQRLWTSVRHWKFEYTIHNATKHITFITYFLFSVFATQMRRAGGRRRRNAFTLFPFSVSVISTMTPSRIKPQ